MVTQSQQSRARTIKIEFGDEPVTSFGGLALAERMGSRLRLWSTLAATLPQRRGYSWAEAIKPVVLGLLSGAQGTFAAPALREDGALLKLLGLGAAPEEATVWRLLEGLGALQEDQTLPTVQAVMARRALERTARSELLLEGFVPVFADGTLLEGSARREGTKWLAQKGRGLLWSTVFVGPVLCAQRLAGRGQGEHE